MEHENLFVRLLRFALDIVRAVFASIVGAPAAAARVQVRRCNAPEAQQLRGPHPADDLPEARHWVATFRGEPAATGVVVPEHAPGRDDIPWALHGLFIDRSVRGEGVGRALLDTIADDTAPLWCDVPASETHGGKWYGGWLPLDGSPAAEGWIRMARLST